MTKSKKHPSLSDDPVIRTIDVFINKPSRTGTNTLLQLPAHQKTSKLPYNISAFKIKPQSKILEVEMKLDLRESKNTQKRAEGVKSWRKGENDDEFIDGFNPDTYDGDSDNDGEYFANDPDRNILRHAYKSNFVPHVCHAAVGVLKGNELHLNPYSETYQLRYSLANLDRSGNSSYLKSGGDEKGENDDRGGNVNDGSEVTAATAVGFRKKDSDRMIAMKKASYRFQKDIEDGEPWVHLDVDESIHTGTVPGNDDSLFCRDTNRCILFDDEDGHLKSSYLATLNYSDPIGSLEGEKGEQRIIQLMIDHFYRMNAPITTEAVLDAFGVSSRDAAEGNKGQQHRRLVLDCLKKVGCLVRGNWILQSDLTPLDANAKVCRDVLLLVIIFLGGVEQQVIREALTKHSINLSSEDIQDILSPFAKKCNKKFRDTEEGGFEPRYQLPDGEHAPASGNCWISKLPDDNSIYVAEPGLVDECTAWWNRRKKEVSSV